MIDFLYHLRIVIIILMGTCFSANQSQSSTEKNKNRGGSAME